MGWRERIGDGWWRIFREQLRHGYFESLRRRVEHDRKHHEVYPAARDVFRAFELTHFEDVKVIILGQDPYPTPGQAHGLAFSTADGSVPKSLKNIFDELDRDPNLDKSKCWDPAPDPNLERWAKQGVLLLNTTLTVRKGEPGSHSTYGWYLFTEAVVQALQERKKPLVALLFGRHAQRLFKETSSFDNNNILIGYMETSHPSPLGYKQPAPEPFFESGVFGQTNLCLQNYGYKEIDWFCHPDRKSIQSVEED